MGLLEAKYILIVLLFLLAYVYSLEFAPWSRNICRQKWCDDANRVHESCVLGCTKSTKILTNGRGGSYVIGGSEESAQLDNCLVTFWGATHFCLYAIVGFVAPELFWEMFLLGCAFEGYEWYRYDCHDVLDIALNTCGFVLGGCSRMAYTRLSGGPSL